MRWFKSIKGSVLPPEIGIFLSLLGGSARFWAEGTHSIQISIDLVATTDQKSLINDAVTLSGDELLIIAFSAAVLPTNNKTALPESASWFCTTAAMAAIASSA